MYTRFKKWSYLTAKEIRPRVAPNTATKGRDTELSTVLGDLESVTSKAPGAQLGAILPSREDILQFLEALLVVTATGRVVLASSGKWPGMLLSIQ